jgi:hypothetical protein
MRDKLIQGYAIVDLDEAWNTASQDLPDLRACLEPHLPAALEVSSRQDAADVASATQSHPLMGFLASLPFALI